MSNCSNKNPLIYTYMSNYKKLATIKSSKQYTVFLLLITDKYNKYNACTYV